MNISEKELAELRDYRNKPDEDDIRYKQIIKQKLIESNKLIYLLHDKKLEETESEPSDYIGEIILPYYILPGTQTTVRNYLCFETSFDYVSRDNSIVKYQEIIFYVLCHQDDINVAEVSVPRHDLISAVLIDIFNGCNYFGTQMKLVSNKPTIVDNIYPSRTLIFENHTTNSITRNGKVFNLRSGT